VSDHGAAGEFEAGDIGLAEKLTETIPVAGAGVTTPVGIAARPTISVIVCGYTEDRWDDLCRAVRSLHEQTEPALEIILVVDHCPGLLLRAQEELAGLTVVPNRMAKGLSGGRNTGMAEARGDVVAFIDDDAAADPDWLARLADHYQDARVMGVGGYVKPVWEAGRPQWFPPELDWVVGCSYLGMPVRLGQVRNFIGANMSFRREILADLDGFSAGLGRVGTIPLGCEETEFCLRLSQRYPDGVLLYEPAASVNHRVREQRARWGYLCSRCYAEGLSKAKVARLADADRALASERSYVRSTISRGVGRSLADAARGRLAGLASALALVLAVVLAGVGYAVGRVTAPVRGTRRPGGRITD
jgi:glucosyl-dolichyl phosphate glucuronosyltransferase